MTNREELLNTNEYDLLLRIQSYMDSRREVSCVIDAVSADGSVWKCIDGGAGKCSECIQQWLNTKAKNRSALK